MASMIAALLRIMQVKPFKGKKGPEDRLAIDVASMLRIASLEGRLSATWTCIPHEVGAVRKGSSAFRLAQARYAKAKAMGLITGSADYVFVWPDGGGWIELKAPTGSLSPAQQDFRDWCAGAGTRFEVARSTDDVEAILIHWGVLTR